MSGGGTNTVETQSSPPASFLNAYQGLVTQAQNIAQTYPGYTPYNGEQVAPLSGNQNTAIGEVQNAQGSAQPYINQANSYIADSTAPLAPSYQPYGDQAVNLDLSASGQNLPGTFAPYSANAASLYNTAAGTNLTGAYGGYANAAQGLYQQGANANVQGAFSPYATGATNEFNSASQQITPTQFSSGALQQYESPYTQNVLNTTIAAENNQDAQQQQTLQGNAASQGALGGDRSAVAAGILGGQQSVANNATNASIENQGYTQALGEFNTQQQTGLQAQEATQQLQLGAGQGLTSVGTENAATIAQQAQLQQNAGAGIAGIGAEQVQAGAEQGQLQEGAAAGIGQLGSTAVQAGLGQGQLDLGAASGISNVGSTILGANEANAWLDSQAGYAEANLGNEQLNTDLTGSSALLQAGAIQQAEDQSYANVGYGNYLASAAYPWQITNYEANIAEGLGSGAGGSSSTSSPGPSTASQLSGLGLTGIGTYGLLNSAGLLGGGAAAGAGAGASEAAATAALGSAAFDTGAAAGVGEVAADVAPLAFAARGGRIPQRDAGGIIPTAPSEAMGIIPNVQSGHGGHGLPQAPHQAQEQPGIGQTVYNDLSLLSKSGVLKGVAGQPSTPQIAPQSNAPETNDDSFDSGNASGGIVQFPQRPAVGRGITANDNAQPHFEATRMLAAGGSPGTHSYLNALMVGGATAPATVMPHHYSSGGQTAATAQASEDAAASASWEASQSPFTNGSSSDDDSGNWAGGIVGRAAGGGTDDDQDLPIPPIPPAGGPPGVGISGPPQAPDVSSDAVSTSGPGITVAPQSADHGAHIDPWMTLISAGLGIMGGTSPHALTNIGRGAQQGLQFGAQQAQENASVDFRNRQLDQTGKYQNSELDLRRQDLTQRGKNADLDRAQKSQLSADELSNHLRVAQMDVGARYAQINAEKSMNAQRLASEAVPPEAKLAQWYTTATPEQRSAFDEQNGMRHGIVNMGLEGPAADSGAGSALPQSALPGGGKSAIPQPAAPGAAPPSAGANTAPTDGTSPPASVDKSQLHGADYLNTIKPEYRAQIQGIAEGRVKIPDRMMTTPQGRQLLQGVLQYDPTFDAAGVGERFRTVQDMAPNGTSGKAITAANMALEHAGAYYDSIAKNNGGSPMFNSAKNYVGENLAGSTSSGEIRQHAQALASEARKVFAGQSGGGLEELRQWEQNFPTNATPDQARAYVGSFIKLLKGRMDSITNAYNQGTSMNHTNQDLLGPQARSVWNRFDPDNGTIDQKPQGTPSYSGARQPTGRSAAAAAPQASGPGPGAVDYLRANPQFKDQFDAKYGPGSSARYLGQ